MSRGGLALKLGKYISFIASLIVILITAMSVSADTIGEQSSAMSTETSTESRVDRDKINEESKNNSQTTSQITSNGWLNSVDNVANDTDDNLKNINSKTEIKNVKEMVTTEKKLQ